MGLFNLPNTQTTVSPEALRNWLADATREEDSAIREIIGTVVRTDSPLVRWPSEAILLWKGHSRLPRGFVTYPEPVQQYAAAHGIIQLDRRNNGPAHVAYLASGKRPTIVHTGCGWDIHHIYQGRFPASTNGCLHAVKDGLHFTQSAGIVAIHPVGHELCDHYPAFTWYLRLIAFQKFGYDPDHVIVPGVKHDNYGFIPGRGCTVIYR